MLRGQQLTSTVTPATWLRAAPGQGVRVLQQLDQTLVQNYECTDRPAAARLSQPQGPAGGAAAGAGAGQKSQSAGSQNQEDGKLILPQPSRLDEAAYTRNKVASSASCSSQDQPPASRQTSISSQKRVRQQMKTHAHWGKVCAAVHRRRDRPTLWFCLLGAWLTRNPHCDSRLFFWTCPKDVTHDWRWFAKHKRLPVPAHLTTHLALLPGTVAETETVEKGQADSLGGAVARERAGSCWGTMQ